MPGSFVFVQNAFVGHSVDYRDGCIVGGLRLLGIACGNGCQNFFDDCAYQRAQAGIVGAALFRLASALLCLWGVGHLLLPLGVENSGGAIIHIGPPLVNRCLSGEPDVCLMYTNA